MIANRKADLLLVLTTVLAAAGWIFSKESIQGLPPFGFIGLRFFLASLCLLPFCYGALSKAKTTDIGKAMGVGILLGCALLLWVYAVSVSDTLAEGAFIMSLSMLLAPLIAWPLFKMRPAAVFWLSIPFALAGLFLLARQGQWQQSSSQLWFGAAAVVLAVHFNFNGKYAQRIPTLLLACLQLFVTGLMGLLASLFFESVPAAVDSPVWIWFIMSVLFATSLRYVMQTAGQKHSSPAMAAIVMILEPLWIMLLSILWYDEAMPVSKVFGCILIVFSLLLYRIGGNLSARRKRALV
ncbi:DMT family transporter [Psychromonas ossibalaenae]|uniref:DMT family transporter n=1 Tax=Psychromonas ossibalaenae TaxID=444922 RepID=UPI0003738250|nr:DMT family transporter [Psychromonas ossibalaenae]